MDDPRVLPAHSVASLSAYQDRGGLTGLDAAAKLGPDGVIEHLLASGLRGRGGAGFPTGRKWSAVLRYVSPSIPASVIVNAAEGEPGSFKDRAILRANPYAVIEGAVIAARAVGADRVIVALKSSFVTEVRGVRKAIEEMRDARLFEGIDVLAFEGPRHYLYGEETALLEVLDGRRPFPRIAPPYRHGVEEVVEDNAGEPGETIMAGPGDTTDAPPTLANNVETMANVAAIIAEGPAWFRTLGTEQSPGTVVCTVTGATARHGVGEVPMGTPLRDVIEELGGGAREGRRLVGLISGVANPIVLADKFDVPVSYEGMEAIGSGLGAAGFIVFDDETDPVAVAHGVSRFLGVESCGQCTPCKQDGVALIDLLDRIRRSDAARTDLADVEDRLRTVADSARCSLATQHQRVVGSILEAFPEAFRAHVDGTVAAADVELIAPVVDIEDGVATLDETQAQKQPDWSYGPVSSGKSPAERFGDPTGNEPRRAVVPPIEAPDDAPADRRAG